MPKKPKLPKKRNPIAKQAGKMRTKIKPSKKKTYPPSTTDIPSTGNYNYNSSSIFGGE